MRPGFVETNFNNSPQIPLRISTFDDFTPISPQSHRCSIYTRSPSRYKGEHSPRLTRRSWVCGMPGGHTSKLIAIIDDNESMQDSLCDLIESGGFEARCFGSAKAFLESDLHGKAACLIVDIRMPRMSGLELQARLKQEECNVPIIFITAFNDAEVRAQALKEGAVELLAKPIDHRLLLKMLRRTLDHEIDSACSSRLAIAS
jgi:CheY-like chemotaxis protein